MSQFIEYIQQPEIAAVFITALFTLIFRLIQPRARVIWGFGHQFCHSIPQANNTTMLLYSKNVFIKNTGKSTASNIEIHFSHKPEHYQIWPPCEYSSHVFDDGHFMLRLSHLGKNEYANIEMLQTNMEPPPIGKIRTLDGECKNVLIAPQQIFPTWFNVLVFGLLLIGIYKIAEWLLSYVF